MQAVDQPIHPVNRGGAPIGVNRDHRANHRGPDSEELTLQRRQLRTGSGPAGPGGSTSGSDRDLTHVSCRRQPGQPSCGLDLLELLFRQAHGDSTRPARQSMPAMPSR
jgi:hypothetical protein